MTPTFEAKLEKELGKLLVLVAASRVLRARIPLTPGLGKQLSVSLSLAGVAKVRTLKRRYFGQDLATDVLSFPAPAIFQSHGFLGELVICEPVLKRQAKKFGHSPLTEGKVLMVHGVLHLLGMDHDRTEGDHRLMRTWEKRLLSKLGLSQGLIERAMSC